VNNGYSRHMTQDKSLFNGFQKQEVGMSVELGDDATYPMRGVGSNSFKCLRVMYLRQVILYLFKF